MTKSLTYPHTIINVAMTADGKIDTFERQGAQISSDEDWERVDRLRAESDAVMVGGKTLTDEDPRLTVKNPNLRRERIARGLSANPTKVGVISVVDFPLDGHFLSEGPAEIFIFTTQRTEIKQVKKLENLGVQVFIFGENRVDLNRMMRTLPDFGIEKVLVEGGGTLNSALIQAGLVNEIHIYIAPLVFGGQKSPTLADGLGLTRETAIQLQRGSVTPLPGGGVIIQYRLP